MKKQLSKGILIVVILALVLVVLVPCLYGILLVALELPHRLSWRDRTSPLSNEVLQDICQKFNLSNEDPRCKPGAKVYAPEFFQTIQRDFIHSDGEVVNYDYVQEKIGKYQYDCGPMIKERTGAEYFSCDYDLQGDRVYPIGILFDSKGNVWRYFATTSD